MEEADSSQIRDRALLSLEGRDLEGLVLHVELGAVSSAGARWFELFLEEPGKEGVSRPALRGFYRRGRDPAANWVEVLRVRYPQGPGSRVRGSGPVQHAQGGPARAEEGSGGWGAGAALKGEPGGRRAGEADAWARIEEAIFKALADLVPAGGHMMVEYETRPDTERALSLGVPPAATSLGSLLLRAGCGTAFKDWYFSEGWTEGPRKLQGYKALDPDHARRRARGTATELLDFLSRPRDPRHEDVLGPARRRALEVLRGLQIGDDELDRRIGEAVATR